VVNGQKVLEAVFEEAKRDPLTFAPTVADLFAAMAGDRPTFFGKRIPYFNGGLFDLRADDVVIDLSKNEDARTLLFEVNLRDWRDVEPSIFGRYSSGRLTRLSGRNWGRTIPRRAISGW